MNIKELAKQAGFYKSSARMFWYGEDDIVERFAELVAEQTHTNNKAKWYQEGYEAGQHDEREACAKVCDDIDVEYQGEDVLAIWCAAAIRARGEK